MVDEATIRAAARLWREGRVTSVVVVARILRIDVPTAVEALAASGLPKKRFCAVRCPHKRRARNCGETRALILQMLAQGYTRQEIASRIGVTKQSVCYHFRKLRETGALDALDGDFGDDVSRENPIPDRSGQHAA